MFHRNTPAYTIEKIKKGMSPRIGKASGMLEKALITPLFTVALGVDTATITFHESMLRRREPQAKWFANKKVPGLLILALNPAWLRSSQVLSTMNMPIESYRKAKQRRTRYQMNPAEAPAHSIAAGGVAGLMSTSVIPALNATRMAQMEAFADYVRNVTAYKVGPLKVKKGVTVLEAREADRAAMEILRGLKSYQATGKLDSITEMLDDLRRFNPTVLENMVNQSPVLKKVLPEEILTEEILTQKITTKRMKAQMLAAGIEMERVTKSILRYAKHINTAVNDTTLRKKGMQAMTDLAHIARIIVNITIAKLRFWRRR